VLAAAGCGNSYVVPNGATPTPEAGLGAGTVLELNEDVAIPQGRDWQMIGQPGARCVIHGNGHSIGSGIRWTGHFLIQHCDIDGLGTADTPGIHLNMGGAASAVVEDSTFAASGQVYVLNYEQSTVDFSRNTVFSTSLVPAVAVIRDSQAAFFAQGDGTGKKRFAGNLILHSYGDFRSSNWLIGGDGAADGNRFIGKRTGLYLEGSGIVVRGNYIHTIYPTSPDLPHGQEVSAFALQGDWPDLLVEHNVIRHGHWILRGVSGEVRYNALVDADDSDWIREPEVDTKIHHNVFVNYLVPGEETNAIAPNPTVQGGIEVINFMTSGIRIWANTFDGGGPSKFFHGSTISVAYGSAVDSVRSNVFMRFPYGQGSAGVGPGAIEQAGSPPPVLGYADYNLFFNPDGDVVDNYGLAVEGKVERQDPGFGANDIPPHGAKDAQVDPQVTGPLADRFPWTDDQIQSGAITVTDMLAYFRTVYAPRPGSPLIDAGDPQDGNGADIGAIGAGAPNAGDAFGSFPAVSPNPVGNAEGGVAASARSESDGPLKLRCSTRPPGDAGESAHGVWLGLGWTLCLVTRSLRRKQARAHRTKGLDIS